MVISESVKESKVVAIDIEGDLTPSGRLSLIQVGLESEEVFIFDLYMCPDLLGPKAGPDGLRALLSSNIKKFAKVTKVLHDCRADAAALKGQFGILLPHEPVCTVWDTQTYHSILEGKNPDKLLLGLNVILQKYAGQINQRKDQVKHRPGVWEQRPLPQLLLVQVRKSLPLLLLYLQPTVCQRSSTRSAECLSRAKLREVTSRAKSGVCGARCEIPCQGLPRHARSHRIKKPRCTGH